jgi:hypothetical protein
MLAIVSAIIIRASRAQDKFAADHLADRERPVRLVHA